MILVDPETPSLTSPRRDTIERSIRPEFLCMEGDVRTPRNWAFDIRLIASCPILRDLADVS